jgi:hypothetical protein
MKWLIFLLLVFASVVSQAQVDPWNFAGQFPHFRDLSGLPGAGFGVSASGQPTIEGAMAISTPIGFSLAPGTFDIGLSCRSVDNQPRFFQFSSPGNDISSGTGQVMGGFRTPLGSLTVALEVLSSRLDSVANAQLQLPLKWDKGGVSVGIQNIWNRPEAASQGVVGEHDLSRSYFAVATWEFSKSSFISLGDGDVRFQGVFGSISAMPAKRFRVLAEYDTFGWNPGVAYSLGQVPNLGTHYDKNEATIAFSMIQLHRSTLTVNFAF